MEQRIVADGVLDAANVPEATQKWMLRPSPEIASVRDHLELIVRLFDDLDAAMDVLAGEVDGRAYQLSHQVRAEMIHELLLGVAGHFTDELDGISA